MVRGKRFDVKIWGLDCTPDLELLFRVLIDNEARMIITLYLLESNSLPVDRVDRRNT